MRQESQRNLLSNVDTKTLHVVSTRRKVHDTVRLLYQTSLRIPVSHLYPRAPAPHSNSPMDRLIFDVALPIWLEAFEAVKARSNAKQARRWLFDIGLFDSKNTLALGSVCCCFRRSRLISLHQTQALVLFYPYRRCSTVSRLDYIFTAASISG